MQRILDEEKWETIEVPSKYFTLIENLHNSDPSPESSLVSTKQLTSDEISYWCTKSLLTLFSSICEYIDIISGINEIVFEAFCNLIELIRVLY